MCTREARSGGRPGDKSIVHTWKSVMLKGCDAGIWEARHCERPAARSYTQMEAGLYRRPHHVHQGSPIWQEAR